MSSCSPLTRVLEKDGLLGRKESKPGGSGVGPSQDAGQVWAPAGRRAQQAFSQEGILPPPWLFLCVPVCEALLLDARAGFGMAYRIFYLDGVEMRTFSF